MTASTHNSTHNRDYSDLKKLIVERKLLQKQTRFYIYKVALSVGLLATSIALMIAIRNPYFQLFNAIFLGFASSQVAFLAHDSGHRQIARTAKGNDLIGYIVGNVLLGASFTWWMDDHNRHHSHTNDLEHDPNVDYPIFAFDRSQLADKKGIGRFIVTYQKYFFFPVLSLSGINLKAGTIKFLWNNNPQHKAVELVLLTLHHIIYFGLIISVLGWWSVPFMLLHQLSFGLFLGSVFAPNHKGMPMMSGEARRDYLRVQVLTSRNVKAHPVTDFMFGGLNYQIEHHLFPSIPRNKMRDLQKVVRSFCEERKVSYHETTTIGSYREIVDFMHEVSAPLREKGAQRDVKSEQHDGVAASSGHAARDIT